MSPVKFSSGALSDLARLQAFLKEKNPIASQKAAATIIQAIRILEHHPQIGRPVDDLDPVFRELAIGFGHYGYVALYRLESDAVVVVAIRHQLEAGYYSNKD
ncbi:MAG: type II toxin-antitoxin system RelE/ParE family toxin [Desulfobulbaceae bacterium]|nr:type II toxin-antitoxin system RelE/ParE family toxin [Desulfobulbaceae bacterium]